MSRSCRAWLAKLASSEVHQKPRTLASHSESSHELFYDMGCEDCSLHIPYALRGEGLWLTIFLDDKQRVLQDGELQYLPEGGLNSLERLSIISPR